MAMIRPYTPADYPSVERVLDQAGVHEGPRDSERNYNFIAAFGGEQGGVFVAEEPEEGVIGSVLWTPVGIEVGCVWALAVSMERRREGIGTQLLERVIREFKDRGFTEGWAFTNVKNVASAALLEKAGFKYNRTNNFHGPWIEL